jgi:hypothetical protein|tara:strand:+ start:2392 stop:3162 length:771 start_codon:yes stop_codon:yes gene_type:complete
MKVFMNKSAFLLMLYLGWSAVHAKDLDIIGLKLGMNVTQVHDALKLYGVEQKNIRENRQYYNYTDGIEQFQTDDFVTYINAFRNKDGVTDALGVFISPGPQGGRVVAVTRDMENRINPPTRQQYLDALKKKYGPPVAEDINTVQWEFPAGKIQCLVGNIGTYQPAQSSILKKIYGANVGSRDGTFHNQKAKSLTDCASYLTYAMPSGDDSPVTTARAIMVDVAGTADGELSANEWVAALTEQVRKARAAKGATPEL